MVSPETAHVTSKRSGVEDRPMRAKSGALHKRSCRKGAFAWSLNPIRHPETSGSLPRFRAVRAWGLERFLNSLNEELLQPLLQIPSLLGVHPHHGKGGSQHLHAFVEQTVEPIEAQLK